jgi:hypothetical protein
MKTISNPVGGLFSLERKNPMQKRNLKKKPHISPSESSNLFPRTKAFKSFSLYNINMSKTNDNTKLWGLLEKIKLEARMNDGLADRIQRLLETPEGKVIIIDNFMFSGERNSGAPDYTFIGRFKRAIPKKLC